MNTGINTVINENLVIVPTHGRGKKIVSRLSNNLQKTCQSDYVLALDNQDDTDYEWASDLGIRVDRGPSTNMNQALNRVANKFANDYKFLSFLGDDHFVKTDCWDKKLMRGILDVDFGVTFGDDELSSPPLATFVMLDAKIVQSFGYFAPPKLRHMFLDDYWMHLGKTLGTLRFNKEVIVAHQHFSSGLQVMDQTYKRTNRITLNLRDRAFFELYKRKNFTEDIRKLLKS